MVVVDNDRKIVDIDENFVDSYWKFIDIEEVIVDIDEKVVDIEMMFVDIDCKSVEIKENFIDIDGIVVECDDIWLSIYEIVVIGEWFSVDCDWFFVAGCKLVFNDKIAAADTVTIASIVYNGPLYGMNAVGVLSRIQYKIPHCTTAVGVSRKQTGNIGPVNIVNRMPYRCPIYPHVDGGTIYGNIIRLWR